MAAFHDSHKIKIRGDGRFDPYRCIHGICHDFPLHTILSLNKNRLLPIQVGIPFIKVQAFSHSGVIFQSTPSTWLPSSGKIVATPLPFPLPQKVRRYPSSLTFSYGSCRTAVRHLVLSSCCCHRQNNRFLSSLTS